MPDSRLLDCAAFDKIDYTSILCVRVESQACVDPHLTPSKIALCINPSRAIVPVFPTPPIVSVRAPCVLEHNRTRC